MTNKFIEDKLKEFEKRYGSLARVTTEKTMLLYWLDQALLQSYQEGVKRAIEIANESKATFFVQKDSPPPSTDDALYELKAEIVTNLEMELMKQNEI